MRYHNNGSGFTVSFTADDAQNFSAQFPGSSLDSAGSFGFQENGDLVEVSGAAEEHSGEPGTLAFSQNCQEFGERKHRERKAKQLRDESEIPFAAWSDCAKAATGLNGILTFLSSPKLESIRNRAEDMLTMLGELCGANGRVLLRRGPGKGYKVAPMKAVE